VARVAHQAAPAQLDLILEHLDELAFLLSRRRQALHSVRFTLRARRDLEERILAHRDALWVAAEGARAPLEAALHSDPEHAAAAAAALLAFDDPKAIDAVLSRCGGEPAPALGQLGEAFRLFAAERALRALFARANEPAWTLSALDVAAFRRIPVQGLGLPPGESTPAAQAVFWRAIARTGLALERQALEAAWAHDDPALRDAAFWAAAWRGERDLSTVVRDRVVSGSPDPVAVRWLGVLGNAEDLEVLEALCRTPSSRDAALEAIGRLGVPRGADILLAAMKERESAASATLGFRALTGIEPPPLPLEAPTDFDGEFVDPLPDVGKAEAAWQRQTREIGRARRWRGGREASPRRLFDRDIDLLTRHDITLRERAIERAEIDLELEALEAGTRAPA